MTWPEGDEMTAGLPSPRDDEPENLRRDIADELQDHLACAMDRESRRTTDGETAKTVVLQQFGSPTQLARRLWWDAMKEKIMSQRLTFAATGIAMAACLGVFALSWMMFEDSRKVNLAIVSKLESLTSQQPAEQLQSLEWTNVTFRCVQESEDGPPAEGFRIQLHGNPINESQPLTLNETVNSDGVVTFGPIRPGKYTYLINSPWNQSTSSDLVLLPGAKTEQEILCPIQSMDSAAVTVKLNWPKEARQPLDRDDSEVRWILCSFDRTGPAETLGKHHWYAPARHDVLVMPDGRLIYGIAEIVQRLGFTGGGFTAPGQFPVPDSVFVDLKKEMPQPLINLSADTYTLSQIMVLQDKPDPKNASQRTLQGIIGYRFSSKEQQNFKVKFGEQNDWSVDIPVIKPLQLPQY